MSNPALCGETQVCDPRADASTGCAPGRPCAADRDCEDTDPCTQSLGCDHTKALCRYKILDSDGDGHWPVACGGRDCDDAYYDSHPGADELCDGRDNDCDGVIDPPAKIIGCEQDRSCRSGACRCNAGLTECLGECIDPESFKTSRRNCGSCDHACHSDEMCDQGKCIDRDECADGSARCPDRATCRNSEGSYRCVCEAGYSLSKDNECVDYNECLGGASDCDTWPSACVNTDGGFECKCPKGYEGTGLGSEGCTDIDECLTENPCGDQYAACTNREGDFWCSCASGFTGFVGTCTNVDECAGLANCDDSPGTCVDTVGSFTCECPSTHTRLLAGAGVLGCGSRVLGLASGGTGEFSCALLAGGRVECWGRNETAQLGTGDQWSRGTDLDDLVDADDVVNLGSGRSAKAIAAGSKHVCAILDDDSLRCWGDNARGQLGIGSIAMRGEVPSELGDNLIAVNLGSGRTAKAVVAGDLHTCAILDTGAVKCWGDSTGGQLGLDGTTTRGGNGDAMGDTLPAVNLGAGRTARMLTAGRDFTCALLDDSSVKCWGNNSFGQLGQGDANSRGYQPGDMAALAPVSLGTGLTAKVISAGVRHACAILSNDTVKCWGSNYQGGLGLEASGDRGDAANEMGNMLPPVFLGSGRTVKAIAAGDSHTCAVLDDGSVKCWGDNQSGQLGLGSTTDVGETANSMHTLMPVNLGLDRTATAIRAAPQFTCAILDDERVKCWGLGTNGRLGVGDFSTRGDQASEMGDSLPYTRLGG